METATLMDAHTLGSLLDNLREGNSSSYLPLYSVATTQVAWHVCSPSSPLHWVRGRGFKPSDGQIIFTHIMFLKSRGCSTHAHFPIISTFHALCLWKLPFFLLRNVMGRKPHCSSKLVYSIMDQSSNWHNSIWLSPNNAQIFSVLYRQK